MSEPQEQELEAGDSVVLTVTGPATVRYWLDPPENVNVQVRDEIEFLRGELARLHKMLEEAQEALELLVSPSRQEGTG